MKYYVRIGEQQHEVHIEGETITVDGESLRAHVEDLPGTPLQLLAVGSEVHRVLARRGDAKGRYDLALEGHRFTVEALDDRSRAIRELSGNVARPAGPAHLTAPMPGLIVRVNVKEGQQVGVGQGLVVMEAMKMENELRAAASGTVKRVVVKIGNVVEKGALLLEME